MFEWLESTPLAIWVGESLWGYPFMLGLHVTGLSIVVGVFAMRDLRLLGLFDGIEYVATINLFRLGWAGFAINALSGFCLFSSQASYFVTSTPFLLKILMIFLAATCAAFLQRRVGRGAEDWDRAGRVTSTAVKAAASASIALWAGAIVSGRLIAYL